MKLFMTNLRRGLEFVLSRIAALLLTAMTFLVLYQVFTRYVLNNPASWTEELVRYLLIWTGFIGAAYGFSTRAHMSLIFFRDKQKPAVKKALTVSMDVLIVVFAILVLVSGGFKLALSTMLVKSSLLGFPRGLVYIMAPVAGIFITLVQLVNIYDDVTGNDTSTKEDESEEASK